MKQHHRSFLTTSCLTAVMVAALGSAAQANPLDGTVVGGAATITETGKKLDVVQTTDRAVIDWRSFNIAPDEHTQFYQPNSSSIAVNRVTSVDPSTIAGKLSANGNVVLINPNGVFFSKTATVDVNGLVATTADIDNSKFMAGGALAFTKPGNANAAIINEGTITAKEAGLVGLVAPNVINSGTITAKLGRVQLASGDSVTVDLYGDGLMEVKASDALTSQVVENSGRINAAGGTIALSAAAGRATVNSVVKVSGELLAPSVAEKNGKIIIAAEGSNKTSKSGSSSVLIHNATLDVSGRNIGERGGNISVTGDHITIGAGSVLDASGYAGGGSVLLGGDYQGKGSLANAQYLTLENGVTVAADALASGAGGRIILWSDESTLFAGALSARGGATGGMGGFVETSGKHYLTVSGTVNLAAADGSAGTWLLDPTDITIYNRSGSGDLTNTFTAAQLESMSVGANVSLSATNNITLDLTGDTATLTSGRNLTLTAGNDILTASTGGITTSGTGGITFAADANMQLNGLHLQSTGTGNISLRGVNSLRTDAITLGSGNLTLSTNDNLTIGGQLTGTSELFLVPYTAGTKLRFDNGTNADFSLNTAEIALLQSNWSMIYFGRADGTLSFVPQATTWHNPLTIRNSDENQIGSQITMTNGASLTFENGTVQLFSDIITDGGDVNFTGNGTLFGRGGQIATNGGDLNLKRFLQVSGIGTYDTRGSGSNGDINLTQGISETYSTSALGLNLYAGTGTIAFGGAVDGIFGGGSLDIVANGGALTFNGAWGMKGANNFPQLRNITLSSINTDITLPNFAVTGNVSVNAGTGTITTASIATGAGNLSLISDDLTIGGGLSGTGNLLLRPFSNRNIRLNWYTGDYNIDATELAHLTDGWNLITIGHSGASSFAIGDTSWTDNLALVQTTSGFGTTYFNGTQTFTGGVSATYTGAYIDITKDITTDGGSLTFNGIVTSYGNALVASNGGNVNFNDSVRMNASGTALNVNSGGGDITFANTLFTINGSNAGKTVLLNAGAGDISFANTVNGDYNLTANAANISFNGAWGGTSPLGNVSLTSLNTDFTMPTLTTAGNVALNAGTGTITTGAISTGAGNLSIIADDVVLGGNLTGTGTLTLQPSSTNRIVRINDGAGDFNLSTAEITALRDGWSQILIGNASSSVDLLIGDATFVDPVTFRSSFRKMVGAGKTLAGTGNASITFASGGWTDVYGAIATANQAINLDSIFMYSGSIASNGGAITINNSAGWHNSSTGFSINSGGGNITFASTLYESGTSTAGKLLSLEAGAGTIGFGNTVNLAGNVTANAGTLNFNGAWGNTTPLGNVSLTSVNSLTLPSISAASIFARTTGAVADIVLANTSHLAASGTGNAITLASARNFINSSGTATPFTLSGGGRWLTYSTNPANDTLNGLTSDFTRTGCSYVGGCSGGTTIPAAGNGFIYSYTPVVVPPTPTPDPDPAPSTAASDLPSQVLRAINTDPYMPRYVLIELPVNSRTQNGEQPRKQRIETAASSNRIDYDSDLSLTLSPALKKRLEKYMDI